MMRILTLLQAFLTNSIQIETQYRANFMVNILTTILTFFSSIFLVYALFTRVGTIGGWTLDEAIIIMGIFLMIEGVAELILSPNLTRLSEYIRRGSLDFMLLKPVNSQFLVSTRFISIWGLPNILVGFGFVIYAMLGLGTFSMANVGLLILMLIPSLTILYAIWCMLCTTAFWWVQIDNITFIFYTIIESGRFPITAFPAWLQVFLTFVIPVAFMTTVPAEAALGTITLSTILTSWAIAALFLTASHLFWRFAIRNYTSASS